MPRTIMSENFGHQHVISEFDQVLNVNQRP
jgi:hypothetical protein